LTWKSQLFSNRNTLFDVSVDWHVSIVKKATFPGLDGKLSAFRSQKNCYGLFNVVKRFKG